MDNTKYDQEFVDAAIRAFDLEQVRIGFDTRIYSEIIRLYDAGETQSECFKVLFNKIYLVDPRYKNLETVDKFFKAFESIKKLDRPSIIDALLCINEYTGSWELSYASKALNTINPKCPIYDSCICEVIKRLAPETKKIFARNNIPENALEKYELVEKRYTSLDQKSLSDQFINAFNNSFPDYENIPNMKKIDYVLWAYGKQILDDRKVTK